MKIQERDGTALMAGASMWALVMRMQYAEATNIQSIYSLSITVHKCAHKKTDDFSRFSSMNLHAGLSDCPFYNSICGLFVSYSSHSSSIYSNSMGRKRNTTQFSLFFSCSYLIFSARCTVCVRQTAAVDELTAICQNCQCFIFH